MSLNYEKTNWKAGKQGGTSWTPERLNNIENGIEAVTNEVNNHSTVLEGVDSSLELHDANIKANAKDIQALETKVNTIQSHIGMIIQSTTLDTMEKVIDIYGGLIWEKIEGRFLLGASDDYGIATTGGEATHTLTVDEMPEHSHNTYNLTSASNYGSTKDYPVNAYSAMYIETSYKKNSATTTLYDGGAFGGVTSNAGGSQPHNNMPPYKVVYIWERTA